MPIEMASQSSAPIEASPSPTAKNPRYPADQTPRKKKKLSKGERLALKRQKRILRKENALETKKQTFRDFLERELKYSELNYKKGASDWEAICKAYKEKELHGDMMALWQDIKKTLDHKDVTIQTMLLDIDSAEENYRRHFSKHIEIIENLIKLHKHFVDIARAAFEEDAAKLIIDFQEDMQEINATQDRHNQYYENVHHATNLITDNTLNEMQNKFTETSQEMTDTHFIRRMSFHNTTLRKMEQIRSDMLKIVNDLQISAQSPRRIDLYNRYLARHEHMKKDMEKFREKSKQLESTLSRKQSELVLLEIESSSSIAKLRGERSHFVELYWQLKKKFKKLSHDQHNHIKYLALESNRSIQKLKKIESYGELVLTLAACCGKLQMEKEKIIPWTREGLEMLQACKQIVEETSDEDDDPLQSLQLFWNRVGQAEMHVLCLREKRVELKGQNEKFLEMLKSYTEKLGKVPNMRSLQIVQIRTTRDCN